MNEYLLKVSAFKRYPYVIIVQATCLAFWLKLEQLLFICGLVKSLFRYFEGSVHALLLDILVWMGKDVMVAACYCFMNNENSR